MRVPLGKQDVLAFVLTDPRADDGGRELRTVREKTPAPRAFDAMGLALARFIAEYYVCTLAEALSAVVLNAAIPQMVDRLRSVGSLPGPAARSPVPQRLQELIWNDLRDGFTVAQLLRHPEARRSGDRAMLLRAVGALVRSGKLVRERTFSDAKARAYRIRVLRVGNAPIQGEKARRLIEFVEREGRVLRADALLAGYSSAVITRAIRVGAIHETEEVARTDRTSTRGVPQFAASDEQRVALDALASMVGGGAFSEALLYGVTGSGKTFVYIEAIRGVLEGGGRAIVLVPEISLTPQTAGRFERAFGSRVAVFHSALSNRERFDAWQAAAAGEIDVVVGARSAVFAPLTNVRLLVVDEAHETTYKQDTSPRYNAITVARERMRLERGVLLLGSATPPLESYAAAREQRIGYLRLHERPTAQSLPSVRAIDMGEEFEAGNRRIFSSALIEGLQRRLATQEKSVLFVNRRGSSGFLLCRACGYVPECARCTVSLTAHRSERLMRCHYCDAQGAIPERCPSCGQSVIREFGVGTEGVVTELARLFPQARVVRMDSDTTTRVGDHARLLTEFAERGDILVGTQMVAKGLDFPEVTLVGAVAADIGLHAPEFRAAERAFDLIVQVCGRSGRARPGEAIIQTYSPTHPAIVFAARQDYEGFAVRELLERRSAGFPPSFSLMYLGVIGRSRTQTARQAESYAQQLRASGAGEVLGPAPYPIARVNEEWRYRVAFKGVALDDMRRAVRARILPEASRTRSTRLAVNVDP
ncbi:MAG: primosomal protein N' [Vulcanimicrobiaceae bacterium]